MRKIILLDTTLRDGGYINDWNFGEETIKGICRKIAEAGIEICEVGFIKGNTVDRNRSVFPDIESIKPMIQPKDSSMEYVGMIDMSAPIPLERIIPYDGTSVDGIRVIFKKEKIEEAYIYCEHINKQGYKLFVNFVGTDLYTDEEFISGIKKFNKLKPYAMTIVDTFGLIKRKHFLRLVYLADNNMDEGIVLCYHAHNNLQQAFGNAEALVELNLKRDICVDACVFGMGRGAGNLNLELFAEYMNENYDTQYRIKPMLEIMDEYLNDVYKKKSWGYSLPLYLSACNSCHPNYAIHLAEKDSLSVKAFDELLQSIPDEQKAKFSKENAEHYYRAYMENFYDDKNDVQMLKYILKDRKILLLAPGKTLRSYNSEINKIIDEENPVVVSVNFDAQDFDADFVFSSNMKRYSKIKYRNEVKYIVTSNMDDCSHCDFKINFSSYTANNYEIIDNSGLMALKLFINCGIKEVFVAGMDGYDEYIGDYFAKEYDYKFSEQAVIRNNSISTELKEISRQMNIHFITPTNYRV